MTSAGVRICDTWMTAVDGRRFARSRIVCETGSMPRVSWTKGAGRKLSCVLYQRKKADLTGSMQGSGY